MGYPAPDLQITNNTPYGILIWTSYTDTSLTVTLYSTPYATGRADRASPSRWRGVPQRRDHHPHPHLPRRRHRERTFRATYRPGEGQTC